MWDFPRPPALEPVTERLHIQHGDVDLADTRAGWQVLETSHPPVYYIPPEDIREAYLERSPSTSMCEFKGRAAYYTVHAGGRRVDDAGWYYPAPVPGFEELRGYVAFYPGRVDECWVGEQRVRAQDGDFYGGWITDEIVGPFKGGPGTWGW